MPRLNNPRIAWSVAIAALALWATSAPASWGQVATAAGRFFDDGPAEQTTLDLSAPCLPIPSAIQTMTPLFSPTPEPGAQTGTFRLCGGDQQATARAIEQLIGGHGFSASLSSQGDGCAELNINVSSQPSGGTSASKMNVSLGSGTTLSIEIVSERGGTRVSIGQS
jgi:hypothetical protein